MAAHYYMSNDSPVKHDLYYNKTAFRKFIILLLLLSLLRFPSYTYTVTFLRV